MVAVGFGSVRSIRWTCGLLLLVAVVMWAGSPRVRRAERAHGFNAPSIHVTLLSPRKLTPPPARVLLRTKDGFPVHVYSPIPPMATLAGAALGITAAAPVVMMLHGMCGDPVSSCSAFHEAGREGSWLMCPAGNVRCGDSWDWTGEGERKARHLDAADRLLRERYGQQVSEGSDILIGFSRGAFVARDVAYARPGRYRGLVLIGAALEPDPARLRRSGIERVVLASGAYDAARPVMLRATTRLQRGGVEARFVSTGAIWHQLPADLDEIVRQAVRWIRAPTAS